MRPFNTSTTKLFSQDQTTAFSVSYWNTPFSPLQGGIASAGIKFSMKEPTAAGVFSVKADLAAATASNTATAWTNATANTVQANGRVPNLVGYWAGGAPGYHGASVSGRIAYRFECTMRSTTGRAWWSAVTNPVFWLALGGNGYFKVVKTVSGVATNVLINGANDAQLTEIGYLTAGLAISAQLTTLAAGDKLDIYYVQDQDNWGGFVVKAVQGALPSTTAAQQLAAQQGPVLGCSIMDDGSPPSALTLDIIDSIEVTRSTGSSPRAVIRVPVVNTQNDDNVGWEWFRSSPSASGIMRLHTVTGTTVDVGRHRLVQISTGLQGESKVVFTGFTDDFSPPSNGIVEIGCLGMENRLVDQFQKNYPDKISYMMYAYKKTAGTTEPVYDVRAYDNWPMEYALRDLLLRAGIDESRTRVQLSAPQADGSATLVYV